MEEENSIPFLDVLLTRRPDMTLKRSVYKKSTWTGQYTNFNSFVPLKYKRNLIRTLFHRALKLCTEDTLANEIELIKNTLKLNGYPDKFIDAQLLQSKNKVVISSAPKKPIYLTLPYKGDIAAEILERKLHKAVEKTFRAARLHLTFTTRSILRPNSKDKLPSLTTSMCIYKFDCSCGASYIGRTTRRLSKRIQEHIPNWWIKGLSKSVNSSILAHLLDTDHKVDAQNAFHILHKVPPNLPSGIRFRLLCTAEAVAIDQFKPDLCIQKQHVQALSLPWPENMGTT